eukprot:TRINITY_DN55123_c0_g1_i1.p1 TRINITY_DN55123_c0_g1~~TRINITY_DN55123_c0_g1_i1.p1  ORF type:complete len:169 (-),score=27.00 TRINITY_DN55123_c0_g1_i1:78-584(-)
MGFCPIPHKTRDQVWLCVGAAAGAAVCWWLSSKSQRRSTGSTEEAAAIVCGSRKPQKITTPKRVVDSSGHQIDEFVGTLNTGTNAMSVAHVHVTKTREEQARTPEFDEHILVLAGKMQVVVAVDEELEEILEASCQEMLFLPKGHRYVNRFPTCECTYVLICSPACRR